MAESAALQRVKLGVRVGSRSVAQRHATTLRRRWLEWMHASNESANAIADALGVSRATVYRVPAEDADE